MRPCSREEGRFSPLRTAAPHSYACLEKDEYCQDGAGERPQSPLQCIQANDSIRTETNKKVVKMKSKRYRKSRHIPLHFMIQRGHVQENKILTSNRKRYIDPEE
ncbi:uncharacterized protein ACNLHF_001110 isoform 3-T3 [Anomaloglossus baeobatrachus]